MCIRASNLLILFFGLNLCLSFSAHAQNVIRKEEPILAGVPGGTVAWEYKEQPLDSWGNWSSSPSAAPNGTVFSISGDYAGSGGVIVGGSFDSIGDTAIGRIAEYSGYDGPWKTFGTGIQNGAVYATISTQSNSPIIFAAGTFTMAGGVPVHRIAMWDGITWHPLGNGLSEGVDSTVLAMAVMGDSLFVGGNFTHAGGQLVNHIAIWNMATDQWEPIIDGGIVGVDGGVAALLVPYEQTTLYVGGGFLHAGATAASKIAYLNQGHWDSLGAGVKDSDGIVEALCENSYDPLIVGGHFSQIGNAIVTDAAEWESYDSSWEPVNQFKGIQGTIYCLTYPANLYIGGNFFDSTSGSNYLVESGQYGITTAVTQVNGPVYALLGEGAFWGEGYSEGIYVGGNFSTPNPHFALWNQGAAVSINRSIPAPEISVFPNPATEHSIIRIQLPNNGFANLALYNSLGEKVTTLCQNTLDAGSHDFDLNAEQCQFGNVYFVVLNLDEIVNTYKLIVN